MELRIARSRATKDIDLTFHEDDRAAFSSLAIQDRLHELCNADIDDHFQFRVAAPTLDLENAPYGGARYPITAQVGNKPFVQFLLDVGGDLLVDTVEYIHTTDWLQFCNIVPPLVPTISIEQQFAEKLHAYSLPRKHPNTRVKDLIDLALLLNMKKLNTERVCHCMDQVFRIRRTHAIPTQLSPPPDNWKRPFETMAAECGILLKLDQVYEVIARYYSESLA